MSWEDILKISTEDAIQDAQRFSDDPDVIDQLYREHKKKEWEEHDRKYPNEKNWCDMDRSIGLWKMGWECRHSEEEVREEKEKYGEYGENRYPVEKKRWLENRKKEQNPKPKTDGFEGLRNLFSGDET